MKLNKKGFTIVELVIVIAVIAILAAVLIPTFNSVISKANESAALQEAKAAESVVILHENGNVSDAKYYYVVYDKAVGTEGAKAKYVFCYDSKEPEKFSTDVAASFVTDGAFDKTLEGTKDAEKLAFTGEEANDVSKKIEVYKVPKAK